MPENNVGDLLATLNSNICYDLSNSLNIALGNTNDVNPYVDSKLNTLYYDCNAPPTVITNNNPTALSLNIRSLMSNHSQLKTVIPN
jgi:hypothetical protein